MKEVRAIFFLMSWCLSLTLSARGDLESNRYYDAVFLGEKSTPDYIGPLDPLFIHLNNEGRSIPAEDRIYSDYFLQSSEPGFIPWKRFWFEEVPVHVSCPNYYLKDNIDYIRYLYRLLSISFLFESLKEHSFLSLGLGVKTKHCGLGWSEVLKNCSPKTEDMKTFLRRSKFRYLLGIGLAPYGKGEKWERTWSEIKKRKDDHQTIFGHRFSQWCQKEKCTLKDKSQLKNYFEHTCLQDKRVIQTLCSEKDELYGISFSPFASQILSESHVMKVINQGGHGLSCLERYRKILKEKERPIEWLSGLYRVTYSQLVKNNRKYVQGELFVPGSLKEFDDRGLNDFLFTTPKIVEIPKPLPTPVVVAKPMPTPKYVPQKPVPVVTYSGPQVTPTPSVKINTPIFSQFELALSKLIAGGLKESPVVMDKFLKEDPFSEDYLKAIRGPLKEFQTHKALVDMKTYDKLGSKNEPVRLLFLKLLIKENAHKGLWNLKAVIGDQFYVVNDLEGKVLPVMISLENSAQTQGQWQISVIDEAIFKKN